MEHLNYHHLRYFREVARDASLTQAAARLNVSQSALSIQIKTLEERLGHQLFDRVGRTLVLTEVGQITLDYADRIFGTGEELMATLRRTHEARMPFRIGALSTLSRNFQIEALRPLLRDLPYDLVLKSGTTEGLLTALRDLSLDVVLTTEPPGSAAGPGFRAQRLAAEPVGLYGKAGLFGADTLAQVLDTVPVIVPTESAIRSGFEGLVARLGVSPRLVADVDDMAMVRLLAREGVGAAVAPAIVFADELASGLLEQAPFDLGIEEAFYAVTIARSFPHPLLVRLMDREDA